MDMPSAVPPGGEFRGNVAPMADPRLNPTPDYGSLGPGSDVAGYNQAAGQDPARKVGPKFLQFVAAMVGMLAALLAGAVKNSHLSHPGVLQRSSSQKSEPADLPAALPLDRIDAQKQAETLLQQAVSHSPGAVEQISSRLDQWHGNLQWNSQIANVTTAALNSDDLRVRASGVEVALAAYGLEKNSESLEYLLGAVNSQDHAKKIWALWALGLMANRGVEPDRIVETLISHFNDSEVDSRQWAVEGLALSGADAAIAPLLKTMHDDPSSLVRERAACGLAESGMFTPSQRMTAVPRLIDYSDDPALDVQTHTWAFHALSDITHQSFGNDANAWRQWYASHGQ